MRKRNFNLAPYMKGVSIDTIWQLRDQLNANYNDSDWKPTDFEGEYLPEGEQEKVFHAYDKLITALEDFAGRRKVIIDPALMRPKFGR